MIFEGRELYLVPSEKKLGGVCAGVASYLDIPNIWVRVAAVIALLIHPAAALLAYGLTYMILDEEPEIIRHYDEEISDQSSL